MNRFWLLALIVSIGWYTSGLRDVTAQEFPNIVVIIVDDLGYGELGCQGNPQIPTPNIDAIANNGVRFTQGYVTAPYCSPSRAGLITGRHQVGFGYLDNPVGAKNDDPDVGLPLSEMTIAHYLRETGYVTGIFGKWHLGGTAKYHPLRRGFDEFYGFMHEGHFYVPPPYYDVVNFFRRRVLPGGRSGRMLSRDRRTTYSTHMKQNEPPYDANNPVLLGGQPFQEKEYLTDAITREANMFIRRHVDKPFFLCLSYNAVHSPLQGADRYVHKFRDIKDIQRRIFAAMLGNLDDNLGDVFATLQQTGRIDNTMVFFISDNGGPTRELTSSNKPLRGEKGSLHEGGIRVPFLMQWNGKIRPRTLYRQPVTSLDIASTIQSAVGFKTKKTLPLDGVDLMPYISGKKSGRPHEELVWKTPRQAALRQGDWKLISETNKAGENRVELYDLSSDLSEAKNLATVNTEKLTAIQERLVSALKSLEKGQ